MKKIILIVLCTISVYTLNAQRKKGSEKVKPQRVEEKGKMLAGIHAGLSLTGLLYEAMDIHADTQICNSHSKVAVQGTFDYFVSNKITVGLFGSIQPFRVDITYWEYGDTLNPKIIEDIQIKMTRIYLGGRFLYHYKNTEKIDIYSGLRAGYLFWNRKIPSSDQDFITDFEEEFIMISRPAIGLIPIGLRIKFSPQFAANVELNAGAPHLFSFGALYAF